ncbi:MAG: hypothetical protein M3R55_06510 [Acidobacteriota bacterium]|nr:hypothetical protein [Acidobacteriota bacterium]
MHLVRLRAPIAAACLLLVLASCSGRGFGRQYEYEEQLYLSAGGSAVVVLNASIPSLVALHGFPLDTAPRGRLDRNEVRALVSEPGLEIARVSRPWRRNGRQFIQIRAEIDDVRKLSATKLFRSTQYSLADGPDSTREYRQRVGAPTSPAPVTTNWDGSELVAFKLHLPSRVHAHNVRLLDTNETGSVARGNILTWEQRLADRVKGAPVDLAVTMDRGSILYRTLGLFAASFAAAMLLLAAIIWRIVHRGRQRARMADRRAPGA